MKHLTAQFLLLCVTAAPGEASAADATKPDIVIIYTDDQGYGDASCYNLQSKIPTPNIDRLADEGMRFTDGHCSDTPHIRCRGEEKRRCRAVRRHGLGQSPSYNSESKLRTPNLDKLASQGMRFTDAHSAASVCTPTRLKKQLKVFDSEFKKAAVPQARPNERDT